MGTTWFSTAAQSVSNEFAAISESAGQAWGLGTPTEEDDFAQLYIQALELNAGQEFALVAEAFHLQAAAPMQESRFGAIGPERVPVKSRWLPVRSYAGEVPSSEVPSTQEQVPPPALPAGSGIFATRLADWLDAHALAHSSNRCAKFCRQGLEAAGVDTEDRPQSGDAGDYGPFLLRHGAHIVTLDGYTPQVGDTVVFEKTELHPHGHIEMYDGRQWVSDFAQHGFSPYRDLAGTPPFTIYRLS
jgi:hypothetical protein